MAAIIALAACQSPMEITSEPVNAGFKTSAGQERLAHGTSIVEVRSYNLVDDKPVEFAGASCVVESDELFAKVITPAKLVVPSFKQRKALENRGAPSALIATCSANGKTAVAQTVANQKQASVATGAGLAGALITAAVTTAIASSTPWRYSAPLKATFVE
ncbi:hypothetical protein AKJ29_07640 [Aliiroseovarius crassostreae]|uniref:Uncharacterized protein n=2 Tax=Aliiroseovarius crassostreae TaxID=154981 RepID=A0A0P7ITJ1_9RHOB|nr:hypothetical protein [Aliiroseovarius crassostreae]KPN62136.1 hypothetical protein AKJ29_07640 [Aliiroseovarius crassostreae]